MKVACFFKKNVKIIGFIVGLCAVIGGGCATFRVPIFFKRWYTAARIDQGPLNLVPDDVIGKSVVLRTLKEHYFIDIHNMFSADVRQWLEYPEYVDLEYTIRMLKYEMEESRLGRQLQYCIFDAKDHCFIGLIEVREKRDTDPGQFGCWLNERYRGGGRIQEAIKLISNIYFRLHKVDSFTAHVRLWNKRSYNALLKAGFKDTGKFFYEDGKPTRYLLEYHRS